MDTFQFMSIASSSSGNCYFLGTKNYGFLIDAGVGVRSVKKALRNHDIELENIYGIFITHAHTDHVKYLGVFAEKYNIPVYTTPNIFSAINNNYNVKPKISNCNFHPFMKYDTVRVKDFEFQSFPVSHDANETIGYSISLEGKTFVIATDLGYISKEVSDKIAKANYLVIEANYDEYMLKNGPYSYNLKQRVSSHTGHLNNKHTAEYLANNWHDKLTHIFLCHISGENNTPEIAYQTIKEALDNKNITPKIFVALNRLTPSDMFTLD